MSSIPTTTQYLLTNDQKLLWNDWLCLADVKATNNTVERSYLWGLDLSGSLQGADGIGGLLAIGDAQSGITSFATYDGNGNLTALVNGRDSSIAARYEYDPFGRTLRAAGPMATANPMRFSTKRAEDVHDLAYYGYRFYNPQTGRWLSRDPLGEQSDANRFRFSRNDPANAIDSIGIFSLFIRLHFDVPDDRMPTPAPAATRSVLSALDLGRWQPCTPGCSKRTGTQMALVIDEWFRLGTDLNMLNAAGHTPLEHENGHAQIDIHSWAEPVDADLNRFLGKCLPNACAEAMWSWFVAGIACHQAEAWLEQWDFEGVEFAQTSTERWRTERLTREAALVRATVPYLAAGVRAIFACGDLW